MIIKLAGTPNHIHPELYRDQKYLIPAGDDFTELADAIKRRVTALTGSFGDLPGGLAATPPADQARALQEQVVPAFRRLLGEDHPDTLQSMNKLAVTLRALGDLAGARALHEQVLALHLRVLGNDHSNITGSAWNLFRSLLDLQEWDTAREIRINYLAWLFQTDPQTLSFEQQQIRSWLQSMPQPDFTGSKEESDL